ncbi:MAG: hypothetical protein H8E21_11805 [Gammaproteobacteria bacterium]|nr:hypothetical protein [Gammaproteobacteria bacterium]
MSDNRVLIDQLTIRLPNGWQGDPVYLARKVSEQLQQQVQQLQPAKQLSFELRGTFGGNARAVSNQLGSRLLSLQPNRAIRGQSDD